ncbi:hypothetical protein TWF481_007066 [Arthrobotrys musiformis]|uniref:Uncharacterized protein n=1 Tax=Arthrobotrys musiformis TaxID=47236 RepID=A0AAV9WBB4_9PEZI
MAPPTNHERNPSNPKRKKNKRPKPSDDDTPKAFTRLMAYAATKKRPNGLDEPKSSTSKKRKRNEETAVAAAPQPVEPVKEESKPLTLLPGEKLSDFSRRVDAAIPVSFKGLQRGDDNPKLRKKKKVEEKKEDEVDEDTYDFDDNGDLLPNHLKPHNHNPHTKQKVKGRKERSPSPFAVLREKRGAVQSSINDVVQAPPSLVVPKEKLRDKTKPGGGIQGLEVPKASGSLARREMLQEERKGVLERYRALMAAKGGL